MQIKESKWVAGLDSLRFFMAFVVMMSHIKNPFIVIAKHSQFFIVRLIGNGLNHLFCGAAAVTVFFVISGFVIHLPYSTGKKFELSPYLVRRWLRIGIPLISVTCVALYFKHFNSLPVWSLYCELFYYSLYPIFLKNISRFNKVLLLSYFVSVVFILIFIFDAFWARKNNSLVFFSSWHWYFGIAIISLPSWLLGVLLANCYNNSGLKISKKSIWLYRISIYCLSILFLVLKTHFHIKYNYSLVLFAIPVYFWLKAEILYYNQFKPVKLFENLGKFSYSLYLCHVLCYYFIGLIVENTVYTYFLIVLATIFISYIVYVIIERPSHLFSKWLGNKVEAYLVSK